MLRKILINYEFSHQGTIYKSFGTYVGDTGNISSAKNKDYSAEIVCLAMKINNEQLATMLNTRYWDITQAKLLAHGFVFRFIEVDFYPKPRPCDRV